MCYKDIPLKSYSRAIILALTRTYGEDKIVLEQLGNTVWVKIDVDFIYNQTYKMLEVVTNGFVMLKTHYTAVPLSLLEKEVRQGLPVEDIKQYFKWLKGK